MKRIFALICFIVLVLINVKKGWCKPEKSIGVTFGIATPVFEEEQEPFSEEFKSGVAIGISYRKSTEFETGAASPVNGVIALDYNSHTASDSANTTLSFLCLSGGGEIFLPIGFIRPYFMGSVFNLYILKKKGTFLVDGDSEELDKTVFRYGLRFGVGIQIDITKKIFIDTAAEWNGVLGEGSFYIGSGGINVGF